MDVIKNGKIVIDLVQRPMTRLELVTVCKEVKNRADITELAYNLAIKHILEAKSYDDVIYYISHVFRDVIDIKYKHIKELK